MEREITGERVAAAMRERAMQGKRTCSEVLGYDTTPGGLRVNPAEAARVLEIYRIYEATGSLSETARWCRQHGIRGKRGREMDAYKVRVILSRPIYAGYYSYRELRVRGEFKAIISVDRYNAIVRCINAEHRGRKTEKVIPTLDPNDL